MKSIKLSAVFYDASYFDKLEEIAGMEDDLMRKSELDNIDETDFEVIQEVSIFVEHISSMNSSIKKPGRTVIRTTSGELMVIGEEESIMMAINGLYENK